MPRFIRGPFPELQGLAYIDVETADTLDILERMDLVNEVLAAAGCNCNGHAKGLVEAPDNPSSKHRDEYFGGDLSELICRCTEHEVSHRDKDGELVTQTVKIRLETLTVEVDGNNEVCVWVYEEF